MSVEEILELELAPLDAASLQVATRSLSGLDEDKGSAAVNAGSLMAFAPGVAVADRADILFSMQLAQRAADRKADRFEAVKAWYGEYLRVLGLAGWVIRGFSDSGQAVEEGEVEMAKAALKIIAAAATGSAAVAVLTTAIDALEGMANEDGFITLFEHFGSKGLVGNFQMGAVEPGSAGDDTLSASLGAFQLTMSERQKKFLFFKWRTNDVAVWADASSATWNRAHYDRVRDAVRQRLGDDALDAIALLPI